MTDKTRYLPTCYLPTHTGLLLLLLGLLLTTSSHSQTAEPESAAAAISTPRLVKTLILDSATQGDGLVLPGRVQAAERTQLAFQVGGPLIELPVVEGQQVQKGDLLARLDPRDYENQLALQAAKLKLVQSQYQRFEKLIKTKTSPISKAEFDRKQSEYEIAKADTAQARKNLDDTTLLAPFDGLVAVKHVNNYENVQAKQTIIELEAIVSIEITVDVPEEVMAGSKQIPLGQEVGAVIFESLPDRSFPVQLAEIATRADTNTQTYRATLRMISPEDVTLLPGMTATFVSHLRKPVTDNSFLVPRSAISDGGSDDATQVWVVDAEAMTVSPRAVKLDLVTDTAVTVIEGLQVGERIVTAGTHLLQDGMPVRFYSVGMLGG